MTYAYTIPLPPVTKKNSQVIAINRNTGKHFISPSRKYREYEKQAAAFLRVRPCLERPVNVQCLFFVPTRRRCDLTNLLEAVDDILVKYRVLVDDNYTVIASHDGSRVYLDRKYPRTEIYITDFVENQQTGDEK